MKELIRYAGYCNDKINITVEDSSGYKLLAIFKTKKQAKLAYEDVRKVKIVEANKTK